MKIPVSLRLWTVASLVMAATLTFLYISGFRLAFSPLAIVKTGSISIVSPAEASRIFLGNDEVGKTGKAGSIFTIKNIYPGQYAVIVSKDGYWPWAKQLLVDDGSNLKVFPFMTPEKQQSVEITWQDAEFEYAYNTIVASKITTQDYPAKSRNSASLLWIENSKEIVLSHATGSYDKFFQSIEPVRQVDFYKDRNDVIVFAADTGVYALETDSRGIQNFQPIYTGIAPKFVTRPTRDGILVLDNGSIYSIDY